VGGARKLGGVLGHICVAWDDSPPSRWALTFATRLAEANAARLSIVHVEPPVEHDLVELGAVGRARRLLPAVVASLPPALDVDTHVLTGRAAEQLVAFARAEHVDLLVAGTRPLRGRDRVLAPRLRHALLATARCPVALVPRPPAGEDAVVVGRERWHGMRRRLGTSRIDAVIEQSDSPVVVTPIAVRVPRSLMWRLYVAQAVVLAAALLVLVTAPIQVSTTVVVTEVLVLSAGLAVMLAVHLLVLRRTLDPLRRLTQALELLDARDPGRLPVDARTAEVIALAQAFNELLDRLDEERRQSARRALVAQQDERVRIAREIQDRIGRTLTALTLQAERGASVGTPVDPALLKRIAQTALQSLEDVRRIGRELRPEALDDLGLGNALIALCRRLGAPTGVRMSHTLEPGLPEFGPDVELVVYRIAQEAIANALRHAGATTIDLRLRSTPGGVELIVTDDGRGLPPTLPEDTAGIGGMLERAALVGAELQIARGDRSGTEVRLTLPAVESAVA
jgi:two-component system, NarL family, sensor histidine kinase UhpB